LKGCNRTIFRNSLDLTRINDYWDGVLSLFLDPVQLGQLSRATRDRGRVEGLDGYFSGGSGEGGGPMRDLDGSSGGPPQIQSLGNVKLTERPPRPKLKDMLDSVRGLRIIQRK
jgi:hypothetical protein